MTTTSSGSSKPSQLFYFSTRHVLFFEYSFPAIISSLISRIISSICTHLSSIHLLSNYRFWQNFIVISVSSFVCTPAFWVRFFALFSILIKKWSKSIFVPLPIWRGSGSFIQIFSFILMQILLVFFCQCSNSSIQHPVVSLSYFHVGVSYYFPITTYYQPITIMERLLFCLKWWIIWSLIDKKHFFSLFINKKKSVLYFIDSHLYIHPLLFSFVRVSCKAIRFILFYFRSYSFIAPFLQPPQSPITFHIPKIFISHLFLLYFLACLLIFSQFIALVISNLSLFIIPP